jgi:hypothetical protein
VQRNLDISNLEYPRSGCRSKNTSSKAQSGLLFRGHVHLIHQKANRKCAVRHLKQSESRRTSAFAVCSSGANPTQKQSAKKMIFDFLSFTTRSKRCNKVFFRSPPQPSEVPGRRIRMGLHSKLRPETPVRNSGPELRNAHPMHRPSCGAWPSRAEPPPSPLAPRPEPPPPPSDPNRARPCHDSDGGRSRAGPGHGLRDSVSRNQPGGFPGGPGQAAASSGAESRVALRLTDRTLVA